MCGILLRQPELNTLLNKSLYNKWCWDDSSDYNKSQVDKHCSVEK